MLSIAHRLFDPFAVASPVKVCPKLMLQETWKMSLGLDEEIKGRLREKARITPLKGATKVLQFYKCGTSYKGVYNSKQLLAAALGVRLVNSITNTFEWRSIKRYFWSDSTAVLTWITKDGK
ncbi:hypothetical protein CDAR_14751, partial [Caerostris darwini]